VLHTLFASPRIITFAIASAVLAIVPGPAVIFLTTQTLSHGRRAGLASVGGVALGNLMNAGVASFGLAAILAASSAAFAVIKFAGAAYLVFLGIRALRGGTAAVESPQSNEVRTAGIFRDAVLVALLNPKTALFFAAFLPQFVDARAGSPLLQNWIFGGLFVAIALCTDTAYVLSAFRLGAALRGQAWSARTARYLSGLTFIALGFCAAATSPKSAR
jgi:threonine/homoserine/homoserine lactone efflux protein